MSQAVHTSGVIVDAGINTGVIDLPEPTETLEQTIKRRERHLRVSVADALEMFARFKRGQLRR